MKFKNISLEDYEIINKYYKNINDMNCEYTVGNTILWALHYHLEYTIEQGFLIFKMNNKNPSFVFPIGEGDLKPIFHVLFDFCKNNKVPFRMHGVNSRQFSLLNEIFPNEFCIQYNRDDADYIYLAEDLMNLSGRRYHGKKNHVNKFKKSYNWSYERINKENISDCILMATEWGNQNNSDKDIDKGIELSVTLNALKYFEELKFQGGLIRVDEKVVAFTVGEQLNNECFVIHIEKAFSDIQGAYAMINQQFILDYANKYKYINREGSWSRRFKKSKIILSSYYYIRKRYCKKKLENNIC